MFSTLSWNSKLGTWMQIANGHCARDSNSDARIKIMIFTILGPRGARGTKQTSGMVIWGHFWVKNQKNSKISKKS